jgi:hypothetical protein
LIVGVASLFSVDQSDINIFNDSYQISRTKEKDEKATEV